MHPRLTIHGLLLAGGQSSRMGNDKSLLLWNGKPLYQLMLKKLTSTGLTNSFISSNSLKGDNIIHDDVPQKGPLSGIHAALKHLSDDSYLLVVPVDMPLLPTEALQTLVNEQQTCHYAGYSLPLLLQITPQLRQCVDRHIHSDHRRDYSLKALCKGVPSKTLPLPDGMIGDFLNANTPDEWQRCQDRHSLSATTVS